MLDARLLGYWSDDVLYQGDMEVAEIAFVPDGSGWTYWSRIGGVFSVDRFWWQTTDGERLQLRLYRGLSGTWTVRGGHVEHHVDRQREYDLPLRFAYTVRAGRSVLGDRITVLELDRPVVAGVLGERYAFKHGQVHGGDDPSR